MKRRATMLWMAAERVPPEKAHHSTAEAALDVVGVGAVGGSPCRLRARRPPRLASPVAREPDFGDGCTAAACLGEKTMATDAPLGSKKDVAPKGPEMHKV